MCIHQLGERSAVLFSLDSAKSIKYDEPESYFDLSVNDIKVLIKQLRSEVKGSSSEPLKTAKIREMETEQAHLSLLGRFKTVIIRVQFPNRYVLQGKFIPSETIGTVMDFVRPYLLETVGDFYLCKSSLFLVHIFRSSLNKCLFTSFFVVVYLSSFYSTKEEPGQRALFV